MLTEKPDVVIDEIAERHLFDRGFDNVAEMLFDKHSRLSEPHVAIFENRFQLLAVRPVLYKRCAQVQLHWRALAPEKLRNHVQISLLGTENKEVLGATEYQQDMQERTVKAGEEWIDYVPVNLFHVQNPNRVGVMLLDGSRAFIASHLAAITTCGLILIFESIDQFVPTSFYDFTSFKLTKLTSLRHSLMHIVLNSLIESELAPSRVISLDWSQTFIKELICN